MNKAVKMLMGLVTLVAIVIGVMYLMKLGPFKSEGHGFWHHLRHDIGRGVRDVGHGFRDVGHGVRDVGRGALHIAEHPIRSTEHGFEHVGHFIEHPIRGLEDGWDWLFHPHRVHHHKRKIGSSSGSNFRGQGLLTGAANTVGSSGSGITLQAADGIVANTSETGVGADGTSVNIGLREGETAAGLSGAYAKMAHVAA